MPECYSPSRLSKIFICWFLEYIQGGNIVIYAVETGQFIKLLAHKIFQFGIAILGRRAQTEILLKAGKTIKRLINIGRSIGQQFLNVQIKAGTKLWQFKFCIHLRLKFAHPSSHMTANF